jgi:cephalosporin-C deacetylase-like acetyl esterase
MTVAFEILLGLVIVIGAYAVYLLVVALLPTFPTPRYELRRPESLPGQTASLKGVREDIGFVVDGVPISGWLYLPLKAYGRVPCIVMVNGLGATKDMLLETYAIRYSNSGYAVLTFDHRHLGASGGEPRQLIWIPAQLADVAGALRYVRQHPRIDPERIGLWGTSAGGGHAIVAASRDHRVSCVCAQCPALDGRASAMAALKHHKVNLALLPHAQRDIVRAYLRLSPHRVPIAGRPGTVALTTIPGAFDFYSRMAPPGFVNEACARIALRADKYRPVKHAEKIVCPVLLQICEYDEATPPDAAAEAEKRLGSLAEVRRYPVGHFGIYDHDLLELALTHQLMFFEKHLGLSRTADRPATEPGGA